MTNEEIVQIERDRRARLRKAFMAVMAGVHIKQADDAYFDTCMGAPEPEIVERVARQLCIARGHDPDGPTCDIYVADDPHAGIPWAGYRKEAREIIATVLATPPVEPAVADGQIDADGWVTQALLEINAATTGEGLKLVPASDLSEAQDRIFDMLLGDDGQAWDEAREYLARTRPDLIERINTAQPPTTTAT